MTLVLWGVALILVTVGLIGVVVPVLPGPVLVFAGLFAAAWAEQFQHVGWPTLGLLAILALLGYGLDFAAASLGTRKLGASWWGVGGAAAGAVAGIFFGLPGIFLGPFLGALLGELASRGDLRQAGRAGFGAWVGLVVGLGLKLAVVFAMLAIFLVARIW